MAVNYFLQLSDPVNGPKMPAGESLNKVHAGWIEISSFSFGEANPIAIGSATAGAGAGKVKFNEFQITKQVDSTSAALFQLCASGGHMPTMVLAVAKSAGATATSTDYLKFEFHLVFVSSITWANGDATPVETITFAYGALGLAYRAQDPSGTFSTKPLVGTWSQVYNSPTDSTTPFTQLTQLT